MCDTLVLIKCNGNHVFNGILFTLANCLRDLGSFTKAGAYMTILVTDYNQGGETHVTTTLYNLCYALDGNNFFS